MSVITDVYADFHCNKDSAKCNHCGETLHRYPFFHWRGKVDFFLCSSCCRADKANLISDLVQLAAIDELQSTEGYEAYTFVRKHVETLEAEESKKWPPLIEQKQVGR